MSLHRLPTIRRAAAAAGLLGLLLCPPAQAQPATGCPLIRPAGLAPQQVDAVVLTRLAQALRRAPADLDTGLSVQALSPPGQAELLYGYAALAIGEVLGFDGPARFREAARARGSERPHEALDIAALQAAARAAYAAGTDAPPPPATPGERFRLEGVAVGAPTVETGWHLMRCGHDQVAWWRRGAADDESVTAVLRVTALPPWTGPQAFVDHLRQALLGTVPAGYAVRSLSVEPLTDGARPCADASLVARADHQPWRLKARFCYAGPQARHGHAAMFSHAGSDDVPRFEREAGDFLAQVRAD